MSPNYGVRDTDNILGLGRISELVSWVLKTCADPESFVRERERERERGCFSFLFYSAYSTEGRCGPYQYF